MNSNDQMLLFFEMSKAHGRLRQEIVHSLVYLMKKEKVLPFEQYGFVRYFMPFSKGLQSDLDDAVDFGLLDRELNQDFSMAQWAYEITKEGTAYIERTTETPESADITQRIRSFVDEWLRQSPALLLESSYRRLNEEIMEKLGTRQLGAIQ